MTQPRRFSREFKLEVVQQVETGAQRTAQVCREHQLDERQLRRWRREVEVRGAATLPMRQPTRSRRWSGASPSWSGSAAKWA